MTAVDDQPVIKGAAVDAARDTLRRAVDELTTVRVLDVEHDDGSRSTSAAPALLTQLVRELTGMEATEGSFSARSRPPLRLDAVQLLTDIDREVGARGTPERIDAVHRWGQTCASALTGAAMVDAAALAESWLRSVRELLDPAPKRRVSAPCPACGATKVWSHEDRDNGEHYARPALTIDEPSASCLCDACGARWGIELWEHLRQVLEQQRAETLAAEPWTPDAGRLHLPAEPVQCAGRVRDHGAPGYKTRRCTFLVDAEHPVCRNVDNHEPTGES